MAKSMMKFYRYTKILFITSTTLVLTACNHDETIFQGYVEGDYAYIASAASGNLTQRLVNRGDQVVLNQPLFVLDPQPETSKLEQAKSQLDEANHQLVDLQRGARPTVIADIEAQLKQAQASLEFSQKTLKRYQALRTDAFIDKATFDQSKSKYEQDSQAVKSISAQLAEAKLGARENKITAQKSAVTALEAAVKQAEWILLQKSVRSPVNAQVFDTLYEPGEFVGAGQPVVILLPPQKIKLIFFVPEKIVNQLKIGKEVMINCDSCENGYKAKIDFIAPNSEFTPPVIFSKDSRDKLVYRIEAKPSIEVARKFHPGQPIDVIIEEKTAEK